jgi:rubrerythrin
MPEFGNPFAGNTSDHKLTTEELIRSVRFAISAEYEAIQVYNQMAEATDDDLAKKVLIDIANEERVHAGELLTLLFQLDPDEEKFYTGGEEEVKKLKDKLENSSTGEKKPTIEDKKNKLLDKLLKEKEDENI